MATASTQKKVLGRGLSALIPSSVAGLEPYLDKRAILNLPIEKIEPHKGQPRQHFDPQALEELAQSIAQSGVIQPIIVRKIAEHRYQIVAGERRFRAAQKAALKSVPAIVQDLDEKQALALALIENIQRQDLNPIEEALAYQKLIEEFSYTQEQLAEQVGKERSTITNSLRLLKLPARVRQMVLENQVSMGHARALLALDSAAQIEKTAKRIQHEQLSVRATEKLVNTLKEDKPLTTGDKKSAQDTPSVSLLALIDELQSKLGTRVSIVDQKGRGKIEISFFNEQERERLIDFLLAH